MFLGCPLLHLMGTSQTDDVCKTALEYPDAKLYLACAAHQPA